MRCDCASEAKRGSRLAGFDSMTKTMSPGWRCAWAQETKESAKSAAENEKSLRDGKLARRCITDFTKNGVLLGSRSAGQIRWAAMDGFVGHQREGVGFFGVFGH